MTDTPLAPEGERTTLTPDTAQTADSAQPVDSGAPACPVPVLGGLAGGECPVAHDGPATRDATAQQDSATRMFSTSVVISGIRCVLAYVVFPWILPIFGLTDWLGPWIGIAISIVAIGFNIASIRRFWRADHPWKWAISAINVSVIGLLSVLLVMDLSTVFSN